jgi:hypothetical protein
MRIVRVQASIAGELTTALDRRFVRSVLAAIDTSFLRVSASDFGFDGGFAREVEALGRSGDVLFGITKSANFANVVLAADRARNDGLLTVALTGASGRLLPAPTSGIFAEAPALGKPVAVTCGTWMAAELQRGGAGVEFEDGSVADLAEQVRRLLTHYDDFCRLALERAPAWAAFHNVESLVDRLLAETRRPR